ncbi:hypothetical protein P7H19_12785 [Paenibacillus larvae]|nr:hypothetical protein [Paenibacillus larvae]MDT2236997.1 hypothetical protein [Paenibacillus larvae]
MEHQNFPIDLLFDQSGRKSKRRYSLYSTVVMLENIHDKRYLDRGCLQDAVPFRERGYGHPGNGSF